MKRLWVLPLAALLCGRPVNPPRLKPPLAAAEKGSCLEGAQQAFLLAYAHRDESARESLGFLKKAEAQLRHCEDSLLRSRIEELKSSFP